MIKRKKISLFSYKLHKLTKKCIFNTIMVADYRYIYCSCVCAIRYAYYIKRKNSYKWLNISKASSQS